MESKLKVTWILIGLVVISLLANHEAIAYKIKLEYGIRTAESIKVVNNSLLQSNESEKVIYKKDNAQYQDVINRLRQFETRNLKAKSIPDTYYTFYNDKGEVILTTFTIP